ncbi:class I adenylate-forming enzyme family protein [Natronogracilivirga saccharolytica]|nr:AMP-binding protein [Natronogracilivirga saccharolytica]
MSHPVTANMIKRSNTVLLTDGRRVMYYRDLPEVLRNAREALPALSKQNRSLGIDITDRWNACLWMIYCWIEGIPFVPFSEMNSEPLDRFHPGGVISSDAAFDIAPKTVKEKPTAETAEDSAKALTAALNEASAEALSKTSSEKSDASSEPAAPSETALLKQTAIRDQKEGIFCGLLTSGSSSRPKKVPLLRSNMIAAARNAFEASPPAGSLWGNCLPLLHAGGIAIVFRALLSGTGIFMWSSFDPEKIIRDVSLHPQITSISLVPTMLKRLTEKAEQSSHENLWDNLNNVLVGGGPADTKVLKKAENLGLPVCFSYGMTETCGQIAAQNKSDARIPGSVGKLFNDHQIRFENEESSSDGSKSASGEILVRGPQVFPGYMSDDILLPDAPLSRNDPWFRTGDYGRMESDGTLFIDNRRSDLIISGGENVSPAEVESKMMSSGFFDDVAITGVADPEWGQRVVALVSPAKGSEGLPNDIIHKASSKLKPHQKPSQYFVVSSLPRNAMGKLDRPKLQKLALKLFSRL